MWLESFSTAFQVGIIKLFKYLFQVFVSTERTKAVLLFWVLFVIYVFAFVCYTVLPVPCSLVVVTCWERADLLALVYSMFSCVFDTFPYGDLGQVCFLMVSVPDLCLLPYFLRLRVSKLVHNITLSH